MLGSTSKSAATLQRTWTSLNALIKTYPPDVLGCVVIFVCAFLPLSNMFGGGRIIGQDAAVYYMPMWEYLGDRLRDGEIPAWNPYMFSGTPFAADPESGWMYLPSMILFTLFPLATAGALFMILHFLLAGLGTYAFSRSIGLGVPGAAFAGTAYMTTNWYYRHAISSPAYIQTATWIPLAALGIECTLRADRWRTRIAYGGLAGFSYGQIVAAWLGKGAYYSMLLLGAYLVCRAFFFPPVDSWNWRERFKRFLSTGGLMGVWATVLSLGGILPRLQYRELSNLAHGYPEFSANIGGWSMESVAVRLLGHTGNGMGNIVLFLAIIGAIVTGRRYAAPFFWSAAIITIYLAVGRENWLQSILYAILPEFEMLHRHFPEQILPILYLPVVVLAGIGLTQFIQAGHKGVLYGIAIATPFVLAWLFGVSFTQMTTLDRLNVVLVAIVLSTMVLIRKPSLNAILAGVVFFLHLSTFQHITPILENRAGPVMRTDIERYYDPTAATTFLKEQQANSDAPFRFFGYNPPIGRKGDKYWIPYRYHFSTEKTVNLIVNNRGTIHGLNDIQGNNNPLQLQNYTEYMLALNTIPQDYHEASIFAEGLGSPLLDMLNVEYIIIPAFVPSDRPDLLGLLRQHPTVYEDRDVQVLENTDSLPHAWIVHEAQEAESGEKALEMIASGEINPRTTVLVEGSVPSLSEPSSPRQDSVEMLSYEPEHIKVRTNTSAQSMLVLSELAYPGWNAYVDNEPVETHMANGGLRAVQIPAGEHTVEYRFESRTLQLGTIASGVGYLALLVTTGLAIWPIRTGWKEGQDHEGVKHVG